MGLPINIRPDDYKAPFMYEPPARYKKGDVVWLDNPPIRWGLPFDLDPKTEFKVTKKSFMVYSNGSPTWVATVKYKGEDYQIWEEALKLVAPE